MRYYYHSAGMVEKVDGDDVPRDIPCKWEVSNNPKDYSTNNPKPATEITKEEYEKQKLMESLQ